MNSSLIMSYLHMLFIFQIFEAFSDTFQLLISILIPIWSNNNFQVSVICVTILMSEVRDTKAGTVNKVRVVSFKLK